jgi:arsenate reductase (thioredoxin)
MKLYTRLLESVKTLSTVSISVERQIVLQSLITFIQSKLSAGREVKINFICTHNSRRSQLAQIWAHTAASYYGIEAKCYSGGIELTEFSERAMRALKRSGFQVSPNKIDNHGVNNAVRSVYFSEDKEAVKAFSKLYDDPENPEEGFAAVMTCSDAEQNCPLITGAEIRIPLRYEDPKDYDNTPEEADRYDERSNQIAREMFYVFSKTKK